MATRSVEGAQIFRASLWWIANVTGVVLVGFGFLSYFVGVSLWKGINRLDWLDWYWGVGSVLFFLAYFAGNLGAILPYAVEVDLDAGVRLFAPFRAVSIPLADIAYVQPSSLLSGFTVGLERRHGLVTKFVIPWSFGPEREALAETLQGIIDRRGSGS